MKTMHRVATAFCAATLAAALLSLPQASFAASGSGQAQGENLAAQQAASRLKGKQFSNVKVSVDNGIATLTGTVELYQYKMDAEKKVGHAKAVTAVRNQIQVAGPTVPDQELKAKLSQQLTYDRVGFGHVFDAFTLGVQNGAVTIGGHAHNYFNRDSALVLVSTTPGVKDVIDDIQVDPVSGMDYRIRFAEEQAIYGYPTLNRYALDPARPIRISVQNGNVELYGVVDSQSDKDIAFLRANSVPGVFSVKNYLQVANQPTEKAK